MDETTIFSICQAFLLILLNVVFCSVQNNCFSCSVLITDVKENRHLLLLSENCSKLVPCPRSCRSIMSSLPRHFPFHDNPVIAQLIGCHSSFHFLSNPEIQLECHFSAIRTKLPGGQHASTGPDSWSKRYGQNHIESSLGPC